MKGSNLHYWHKIPARRMRHHTSENLTGGNRSRSPVVAYPLEILAAIRIKTPLRPPPPPPYHTGKRKGRKALLRERTACSFDANAVYRWRQSKRRQRPPAGCPDNRAVAELIYMRVGRKSRIWFTAKIPADKGGEHGCSSADDKFNGYIAYQCPSLLP